MNTTLAIACVLAVLATGLPAQAAAASDSGPPSRKASRQAKAPKPPANTGPAESRKERDQRLLRECKGKPNAGACEGYAN